HRVRLSVRDRGRDPAGRDRRGDRPYAAPAQEYALSESVAAGLGTARGPGAARVDAGGAACGRPGVRACAERGAARRERGRRAVITLSHYLVLGAILFAIS